MQRKLAEKFLQNCWRAQRIKEGQYVFVCTKSKQGKWRDIPLQWPLTPGWSQEYLNDDLDCYFAPNIFSFKRRLEKYAVGLNFIWADLDEVDPRSVWRKPSVAWQSSPGRYAALWRVKYSQGKSSLGRAVTYACGADKGGWDTTQVLRIPGTINHKYKNKPQVELLWSSWLKGWSQEQLSVPAKVQLTLDDDPMRMTDRSRVLWSLMNDLKEAGYGATEIENLLVESEWNKFKNRTKLKADIRRLWSKKELKKPIRKRKTPPHSIVSLDTVKPEKITWLWEPYIPLGAITMVDGEPGSGKSWFILKLASQLSRGARLPGTRVKRGRVLMLNTEDSLSKVIVPRITAMKPDMTQISASDKLAHREIDELEEIIAQIKPRLVVLDPIQAYLGSANMNSANEVRGQMQKLASLAEQYDCAVLCVRHFNKSGQGKSTHRGLGSIDFLAACRSALVVGPNPHLNQLEHKVICHYKNSWSEKAGPPQGFKLEDLTFKWSGIQSVTTKEVIAYDTGEANKELGDIIKQLKKEKKQGSIKSLADAITWGDIHSYTKEQITEAYRWI